METEKKKRLYPGLRMGGKMTGQVTENFKGNENTLCMLS